MLAGETVCTTLVDIAAARQLTEFVGIDTNYKMNCHTSIVAKGHQTPHCITMPGRTLRKNCLNFRLCNAAGHCETENAWKTLF